tara:strand:- start:3961 stop:4113 length:153 start_codon:yes stop_codon:yes gene_type:complete
MELQWQHALGEALGGYFAVFLFDLDSDGLAPKVFRGAKGGAGPHEGVKDY